MDQFEEVRVQNNCLALVPFENEKKVSNVARVHVVRVPNHNNYLAVMKLDSDAAVHICKQKVINIHINNVVATAAFKIRPNNEENRHLVDQVW